jgi:predicted nucleic acid-binding protein
MQDRSVFVDTNIFVYLYSKDEKDSLKRKIAYDVLQEYNCQISTQVLNEFANICTKKLKISTKEAIKLINQIKYYCPVLVIDESEITYALEIHDLYGFSYYDSLIIAAALTCDCDLLITEDLQHGQIILNKLTIFNPFLFKE